MIVNLEMFMQSYTLICTRIYTLKVLLLYNGEKKIYTNNHYFWKC